MMKIKEKYCDKNIHLLALEKEQFSWHKACVSKKTKILKYFLEFLVWQLINIFKCTLFLGILNDVI